MGSASFGSCSIALLPRSACFIIVIRDGLSNFASSSRDDTFPVFGNFAKIFRVDGSSVIGEPNVSARDTDVINQFTVDQG